MITLVRISPAGKYSFTQYKNAQDKYNFQNEKTGLADTVTFDQIRREIWIEYKVPNTQISFGKSFSKFRSLREGMRQLDSLLQEDLQCQYQVSNTPRLKAEA